MKRATFFSFLFFIIVEFIFSQDKIVLISGRILEGKILNITEDTIFYQYNKKNKTKESFAETYRVFSVVRENGNEEIIYKYDTTLGNYRTEEELRSFIYGEQDAWNGYRPTLLSALTFVVAGGGTYFLGGNFLAIVVPFATYMTFMILAKSGVDKRTVRNPKYLADVNYIEGYKRIANGKKNRNALWGSISGAVAGYTIFLLSQPENGL